LQVFNKFGTESGAKISFVYADDHALVRLWSLGLTFASLSTLNSYFSDKRRRFFLLFFAMGFDVDYPRSFLLKLIIIAVSLLSITLINPALLRKDIFLATGVPSLLISYNRIYVWPIFSYLSGHNFFQSQHLFFTALLKIIINSKYIKLSFFFFTAKRIFTLIALVFIVYYGISWVVFAFTGEAKIRVPVFTLWYSIPIQFGFLGFTFTVALAKHAFYQMEKSRFYLYVSDLGNYITTFICTSVNYSNLYYFYTDTPTILCPIIFYHF